MVTPIEYTPQFISTDIGAIQEKLNARQKQYDTTYAGVMAAEDQFGQFDVHAKDIDLKNKIIGGFKDRVKSLVDKYGGDYAAASKQLAREIINTKNDKFFNLATTRNKLAEEQRRLVQQFGPDAIVLKDVTAKDLMDANGNYINPEDLVSDVVSRKQLTDMLDEDYTLYKNKSREYKVRSDIPGYYKTTTIQGITNNEVRNVRDNMFATLKKQKPELPDDIAMNIANAQAKSYVLGSKSDYISNKEWDLEQNRRAAENTPPPPQPQGNTFTTVIGAGSASATGAKDKVMKELNEFKEVVKLYYDPAVRKKLANSTVVEYAEDGRRYEYSPLKDMYKRYEKALAPFKNDKLYIELTKKHGLGPIQAATYVSNERINNYIRHSRYDSPVDENITELIIKDIKKKADGIYDVVNLDNNKKVESDLFKKNLFKGKDFIVEFDNIKRTVRTTFSVEGKKRHYELSMDNIQNNAINVVSKKFSEFADNIYGYRGEIKTPVVLDYGDQKFSYKSVWNKHTKSYDKVLTRMQYNPNTNRNETAIFSNSEDLLKSGVASPLDIGLDLLSDFETTAITDTYGQLLKYKERKR